MMAVAIVSADRARRCDATCHRAAHGGPCACICAGRYHGLGPLSAIMVARDTSAGSLPDGTQPGGPIQMPMIGLPGPERGRTRRGRLSGRTRPVAAAQEGLPL